MADTPERIWITGESCLWPTFRHFHASDLDHSNDEGTCDYPEYVRADLYDAAQAEVARLTAALADAETRGAERMREAAAAWCEGHVMTVPYGRAEPTHGVYAVREAPDWGSHHGMGYAVGIRALPLPPRERDGQEGQA